jgi:hypothetical protein
VIDEHFLARAVLLAHDDIDMPRPLPVQLAVPAVMCCST